MYKTFTFICIIFILLLIGIFYIKNRMIYSPTGAIPEKYHRFYAKLIQLVGSTDLISNYRVRTSDNIYLDTVHLKNSNTSRYIIIFHGNGGNISMRYELIKFLYNFASIVIFDYRSYGRSTGQFYSLSSDNLNIDANTIWNFTLNNLKVNPINISLFGESIGCSVAIRLLENISKMNTNLYPHSLILNSPFFCLSSMVKEILKNRGIGYVGELIALVLGAEFQSNQWIQYINHKTKIIIAHSQNDELIPFDQGYDLYRLIVNVHPHVKFITIAGSHNNPGFTDIYIYTLAELFDE